MDKIREWFSKIGNPFAGIGGLFDNPKAAVYLILFFVIGFFTLRGCEAEASEGRLELGPTYTGQFNGGFGLVYSERFKGKWDVGVALIGEQKWGENTTGNNANVFAQRIVMTSNRKFEMGLGVAYWITTDDRLIGCNAGFTLSARYNITKRIPLTLRHWSNAGTCKPNRGQDLLTIGWRF